MSTFAHRLKKIREQNKFSQKRVADALGISNVQLSRYESGDRKPDPEMIKAIADFFEVSVDYLLGRTDSPNTIISVKNEFHPLKVSSKSNQDEIKEIEQQLERLNNQMQRQIEAHSKGLIEDEDLMIASQRVKEERNLLRAKLEMLKEKKGDIRKVHENAKKLIDDIEGIDRLKAKAGIMKLIESMVIKDEEIDVYWRI